MSTQAADISRQTQHAVMKTWYNKVSSRIMPTMKVLSRSYETIKMVV